MRLRWILVLVVGWLATTVLAQAGSPVVAWEQGNLTLRYPAGWGEPLVTQDNQRWILTLAPAPDADMQIRLSFFGTGDTVPDLNDLLGDEMRALQLQPTAPFDLTLQPGDVTLMFGTSRDKKSIGRGWIQYLPQSGAVLIVAGRAPAEQRREFEAAFHQVTDSITPGIDVTPPEPGYGAQWLTQSTLADGASAFVSPAGLTLDSAGNLQMVDLVAGLVTLNPATGDVLSIVPLPDGSQPAAIAAAPDGSLYVADLLCACVRRLQNEKWQTVSENYAPGAPRSIAVSGDGTLYATDMPGDGTGIVRAIQGTTESRLTVSDTEAIQPLLAVNTAGQILAATDDGTILQLNGTTFAPVATLNLSLSQPQFSAFAVDASGNYVLATPLDGIVLAAPDGQEIARPGQPALAFPPNPGEFVSPTGVAAASDGTIYAVDMRGDSGVVIALSSLVESGQTGEEMLRPGVVAQGTLPEPKSVQLWTFEGARGDIINLNAVTLNAGVQDLAMCLYDPTGKEITCADNFEPGDDVTDIMPLNLADPQLIDQSLTQDGVYFVVVRQISGAGSYQLALSMRQAIEVTADTPLTLHGALSDTIQYQDYVFRGRGGAMVTLTLTADSGTLDPTLILRNARGAEVVRNDDAEDTTLGGSAQIVNFRLPSGGDYVIRTLSFSGSGRYTLKIEVH